jgi:hypothetical protein
MFQTCVRSIGMAEEGHEAAKGGGWQHLIGDNMLPHTGKIRVTLRRTRQRVKALKGCALGRAFFFERRIATRSTFSSSTWGT